MRVLNAKQQNSFVDTSPYFEDLNASFKLLFKSIQNKREIFEAGYNNRMSQQNLNGKNSDQIDIDILNTNGKNTL